MMKQPSIQISVSHKGVMPSNGGDQQQTNAINSTSAKKTGIQQYKIKILEDESSYEPYLDELYPGIAQTIRNDSKGSQDMTAEIDDNHVWTAN